MERTAHFRRRPVNLCFLIMLGRSNMKRALIADMMKRYVVHVPTASESVEPKPHNASYIPGSSLCEALSMRGTPLEDGDHCCIVY